MALVLQRLLITIQPGPELALTGWYKNATTAANLVAAGKAVEVKSATRDDTLPTKG